MGIEILLVVTMVLLVIALFILTIMHIRLRDLQERLEQVMGRVLDMDLNVHRTYAELDMARDTLDDIQEELQHANECESCCGCCDDGTPELPVHLITPEQYYFENRHNQYDLVYHVRTNELRYFTSWEGYIVIDNVAELVGDGLMFFGINSREPNAVYVRNNVFDADFRIVREGFNDHG